jgi:rhodanese-related sulfurtransferase
MIGSLEVDCLQLQGMLEQQLDLLLLDCRETDEYDLARIDGARLVPMSELEARIEELEASRGRAIVVYCHHGGRSLRVVTWLRRQGFLHAASLRGGIDAWSQLVDPSVPRY